MKNVTAMDIRRELGGLLDEVANKNERIVISRGNRPMAVMISMAEYEELVLKKTRERELKDLAEKMDRIRETHAQYTRTFDTVQAVRKIRSNK